MSIVSVSDAKVRFSGLVDEAMKGEIITITRYGKPVAAIVSIEAADVAKHSMREARLNFGEYLMRFPGGVELERNPSNIWDADF